MVETIPEILAHSVSAFADRPALKAYGGPDAPAYTYQQVGRMAAAMAERLLARGVAKATPVALLCENRPEWGIAYFAIHLAGAICVPIGTGLKSGEVLSIVERSRTVLVIASRRLAGLAREAVEGPAGVSVVTLEDLLAEAEGHRGAAVPAPIGCEVRGDDVAVIAFTSGTTGSSKGIVLTHRNIATNAASGARRMGVLPDDRMLSVLPLNHLFEQTGGLLVPLVAGASVTYAGTRNPRAILEAMRQSRTTIVLIVPAMARLFQKRILSAVESQPAWKRRLFRAGCGLARLGRRLRMSPGRLLFRGVHRAFGGQLRFFISGGGALDPALARFFLELGLPVLQGYGLSETAPLVSCNTLGEHVIGSAGRCFPGVEVKVQPLEHADEDAGEILIRGPNVMAEYYEDPRATAEVMQDGWFRTGDLGRVDENGYLHIVGRLKDVIVGESGRNVYPAEVEAQIAGSEYIREVCVLGVRPDDATHHTEEPAALVIPDVATLGGEYVAEHDALLRGEVRKACMHLADYKRPKYFAVWPDEFPRTATLKIKKHEVRKCLADVALKPL